MGAVWAAAEHLVYSYGHGQIVELACILRNYEAAFETIRIRIEVSPSSSAQVERSIGSCIGIMLKTDVVMSLAARICT